MRGGSAQIRLGLAHHFHQVEYAMSIAAPEPQLMHVPICIFNDGLGEDREKSINQ